MANEKRLTDVNYALQQIEVGENENGGQFQTDSSHIKDFLNVLPTVDAVEVVHGRWEDGICTMCGYPIPTDSKCDFIDEDDCLFCYHCGAKMRGGNEDGNL